MHALRPVHYSAIRVTLSCENQLLRFRDAAHRARLESEEESFAIDAAAVSRHGTIRADHAMTGYDDRNRVAAVRETYRAHRVRIADASREFSVADRLPETNFAKPLPHAALKVASDEIEWQIERRTLAGKILVELFGCA